MDDLDELLNNLEPAKPPPALVAHQAAPRPADPVLPTPVVNSNFSFQNSSFVHANSSVPSSNRPTVSGPTLTPASSAPANRGAGGGVAKPVGGDDLDNLLKNLTTQMKDVDKGGPTSRGTCSHCHNAILGEVIQALGNTYHPEHFVCGNCQNPIGTSNI